MKRIPYFLPAIVLLCVGLILILPQDNRKQYENYIESHKYHPSNYWNINVTEIPKKDRPDLAWQQNYLMTMDPALKRPAPERLDDARKKIKEHFGKTSYRTGTTEFPWVERGPDNVGGRTRAIAWDPNDTNGQKVWAGGVTGGLWYTDNIYDENSAWTKVDDFWANISITSIAFDPTSPSTVYVGTGEGFGAGAARGAGIWKSEDGGANWSQLSASIGIYYVNDLVVRDESGTGVLYVATRANYYEGTWHGLANQGLLRSADGGSSFDQVMPLIPNENITYAISDIELTADHNTIWVGSTSNAYSASNRGGGSILYSTDGTTWTLSSQRSSSSRVELACAPSNPNVIYAMVEGSSVVREVLKSVDQGTSWTSLTEPNDADTGIPDTDFSRGQAWYDLILAVDPNDEDVVIAGAIDLFKSSDGGTSWNQISHWWGGYGFPYVHADQHAIVYKPGSSTDVVFGHDGGIDLSVNINASSPTFTNRNNNYNVTQFYACAMHPESGRNYFLAGSQDNGTQKFSQAGLSGTTEATGGDGAFCFVDQNDGSNQISSYVYNSYYLSTNGGATFSGFATDQNTGQFINPSDYDDNLGILYTTTNATSVGRFTGIKSGNPVRSDFNAALGAIASHLRVSPHTTSSTTLFVGTTAGRLFKITGANSSPSLVEITGDNFPAANLACVELGSSEDDLLVIFSNYGVTSVFESKDGGTSWANKEGDLPDMPIRWALYNPEDPNEVILATDLGIWRTTNMGDISPNWLPSNIGLANVRVDMLQIRESDYEVIAATHGRGLYSSSGFMSNNIRASFSGSASKLLAGGTIEFTDNSSAAVEWSWTFEGGTPASSSEQNPAVTYSTTGAYDVTLIVTDIDGNQDTKTINDYINVLPGAVEGCGSVLSASSGTVDDGSGTSNYTNDLLCTWIIHPGNATSITLSFTEFDVEDGWDYLHVYEANNLSTPVKSLTGHTLPGDISLNSFGIMLVFETDESVTAAGWNLTYTSDGDPDPPGDPSNLEVILSTHDQIDLSWTDNSDNETGFVVERSEDNIAFAVIDTTAANASTYSDIELVAETTYYYKLKAYNSDGNSGYSNVAEGTTTRTPPENPSNLLAEAISFDQIDLSWTDNSGNETGFIIEKSEDNITFTIIDSTTADITSYSNMELESGNTYYYRVKAYHEDGDSGYSNVSEATTKKSIPEIPLDLLANPVSFEQIDLSWTDASGNETGFIIERSEDNITFTVIDSTTADITSYSNIKLEPISTYYYRVKAYHEDGDSGYSNVSEATTLEPLPETPQDLLATTVSFEQVDLSWTDASDNETGFIIERSEDNVTFTVIDSTTADITSYSNDKLEPISTYYYRVKAYHEDGDSDYSNVSEATTLEPLPEIPQDLLATTVSFEQVDLSWTDASDNETGFIIERSGDNVSFSIIDTTASDISIYTDGDLKSDKLYYYRIRSMNGSGESAYSNIAEATTHKKYPDISLKNLSSVQNKLQVDVALEAWNEGDTVQKEGATLAYYLSDDDQLDNSDIPLLERALGQVAAGEHEEISEMIDIPDGLFSGDYFLIAVADEATKIEEKDELNNEATASLNLEVLAVSKVKYELFSVYPIPARQELNIHSIKNFDGYTYTLSDISGKTILTGTLNSVITTLDISMTKSGIYNLSLNNGKRNHSFTVLKH